MSSFSQLNRPGRCIKVCLKNISYCLIALTGQKKKSLKAKVENVLKCLLRVDYFPSELTNTFRIGTWLCTFCHITAQRFAQRFLILEDILQKHYITLYYKKAQILHLFNMKTEKSTEIFQKEKHIDTKIFIAKWWIKDEVMRDKDYTHETRAAVLINQCKLNGSWASLENVVSTSNRGDNSLFCLI